MPHSDDRIERIKARIDVLAQEVEQLGRELSPTSTWRIQGDATDATIEVPNMLGVAISPGETQHFRSGAYLHLCKACEHPWISSDIHPDRCPRTRNDKLGPACGVIDWSM